MRRNDKQIYDKEIISEILTKSQICRIAILDEEYPYIIPMNYGYENNTLYFHCASEGKKLKLLKQNNKVGFEIELDHEVIKHELSCNWTTKYRSIIGYGSIDLITEKNEKIKGLDVIMKQHGKSENHYNDKATESVVVLKLHIKELSAKQSGKW